MHIQMHTICLRINSNLDVEVRSGFWWGRSGKKGLAYSTKYSQAVTHPSTNLAQCCLTSVIRRELVLSAWYGRRQLPWLWNLMIRLFGDKLSSSSGLWFQFYSLTTWEIWMSRIQHIDLNELSFSINISRRLNDINLNIYEMNWG